MSTITLKEPVTPRPGEEARGEKEARAYVASQWQLMWWRFREHRVALVSGIVGILIYLVALFAEFIAPSTPDIVNSQYLYAPPQPLHLIDRSDGFQFLPHVFGFKSVIDVAAGRCTFTIDETQKIPVGFFVEGEEYKMWGLFTWNRHLIGPLEAGQPMFLMGADRLGRDERRARRPGRCLPTRCPGRR